MRRKGEFPAVKRAFDLIKRKLDDKTWREGDTLPSIRALSKMTRVSITSVIKAISILKEHGLVTGWNWKRIRAGKITQADQPVFHDSLHWQGKRAAMENDIVSGRLGMQGLLPTMKELQSRYGACFRTMQKVLQSMEADKIITPKGKRYALSGPSLRAYRQKIIFITFKGYFSMESALNHPGNRIVNLFESECMRAGLQFEMMEIDFYDSLESRRAAAGLSNDDTVIGYMINPGWNDAAVYQRSLLDVFVRIESFKKPLAVLDDTGIFDLPVRFASNPLIQVYRIEGKRAAERMARFLLGLGHRNVVYLSLLHFASWSINRYDGIQAQFARAGFPDGVHLAANTGMANLPEILTATGLSDADIISLFTVGNTPSQLADLKKTMADFKNSHHPPYAGIPRMNEKTRDYLAGLIAHNRRKADGLFNKRSLLGVLDAIAMRTFDLNLRPLFEKALTYKNATAWICANDNTALHALSFLREQGINLPEDLSVAGFDNIPVEALGERLTTLDFNALEFISRMIHFITRPPKVRGTYRHQTIEVEGIIMERETTGKAKKI